LDSNQPELEILNITKNSSGYYFCKANNSYGTIQSQLAKLDVVLTDLPQHFIEMSIMIVENENTSINESSSNNSNAPFINALAESIRATDLQNITVQVFGESLNRTLNITVQSIYPDNTTNITSSQQYLQLSSKSRQDLSNSAAQLVLMVYTNNSQIHLENDMVLTVDNTSLTYKATLNQCNPGFELDDNGIVCGKFEFVYITEFE